ncbi:MAG: LysR family transcriptional regulator [Clostridia bacterium]|nr:LysR family transcriptional regulator [Clostridia bacterium]
MSNQIELRHFKYFLTLAEDLHFRKAAERLFISQPGLSRQIKHMEENLGVALFERHNRKVELTIAGKYLYKEIKSNLKRLDSIIDYTRLLSEGIDGKVKLGYVGSAMQKVIPDLLLLFKKEYPKVHFSLSEMDNNKQIQALLDQEIDVGFVRQERVPRGLSVKPVLKETFSLVLPKAHKLNEANFRNLSQLKDEHFIFFDSSFGKSSYEKILQIFDDSGFTPLYSHYTVNASSIFRLVENNFGFSIVPTSLKYGYDMDIKFIELDKIRQRTTLKIAWNKTNTNPVLENVLKVYE